MFKKSKMKRDVVEVVNTDALVPQEHLLRKIDQAIDFEAVYDFVEALYGSDNGRPSADPVVLIKMVFIQHFYGIPSLRQTVRDIEMNIAYRWFLGIPLNEPIPHFATISYAFRPRFTETVVEQIFTWVLSEVERAGYLKPEVVFVDATHIKAKANLKKKVKRAIPGAAKTYEAQLFEEVNQDREKHGKKPFNGPKPPQRNGWSMNRQPIRKVAFSKKENTASALPTAPIQSVNETTLYWRSPFPPAMSTTARLLMPFINASPRVIP